MGPPPHLASKAAPPTQQRQKPRRDNDLSLENRMECSLSDGWTRANRSNIDVRAPDANKRLLTVNGANLLLARSYPMGARRARERSPATCGHASEPIHSAARDPCRSPALAQTKQAIFNATRLKCRERLPAPPHSVRAGIGNGVGHGPRRRQWEAAQRTGPVALTSWRLWVRGGHWSV